MKLGVDLITFFHPGFWDVATHAEIVAFAAKSPRAFWDKILDGIQASGVTGVELTFSPFNWQDAVRTYGSIDGFARQLSQRGLTLASGFFAELDTGRDLTDPEVQNAILARSVDYAAFIAACGGSVMVLGMPSRRTLGSEPPLFVDLATMAPIADFLNRLGAATRKQGVRIAIHTEAHSMFCLPRDIDLLLLLTDPLFVSFCPDTAHILISGGDPLRVVERHLERVSIAHWKDAVGPMPLDVEIDEHIHDKHRPYFCGMGKGRVDWHAWARLMRNADRNAWSILELDAVEDPVGSIKAGREFVETALPGFR